MNSACHNRTLESRLIGHWTCTIPRETCDYSFLPNHEFTCVVTRNGESPFKVRGYWDVLGTQLRIGASALTADPAEILSTTHDVFTARSLDGHTVSFHRTGQAHTS